MKKIFFSLTAMILSAGAFAQAKADAIAQFKVETIDFGKIPQNTPAVATFVVTNIGTKDLIIDQANPTCGCTIGDFTKSPIKPGKTGTITATFNAASLGPIDKHMNVKFAGADDMKSIGFKGEVLSAEDYAKMKGTKPKSTETTTKVVANGKTTTTTVKDKKGKKTKTKITTVPS